MQLLLQHSNEKEQFPPFATHLLPPDEPDVDPDDPDVDPDEEDDDDEDVLPELLELLEPDGQGSPACGRPARGST